MWTSRSVDEPKTIFLFGHSGVGKSTICACLTLFLCEAEGFVSSVDSVENPEGAIVSRLWRKSLRSHNFPPATQMLTFVEVVVSFRRLRAKGGLSLRFLEVAGEDVIKLDPVHPEHAERPGQLNDWMDEADAFLIVASADPTDDDDRYILEGFLDLLADDGRPVCLVLTEWDKLRGTRDPVEFAKTEYGEAARAVADRGGGLIAFSVGQVANDGGTIIDIDFDSGTRELVDWLAEEMGMLG